MSYGQLIYRYYAISLFFEKTNHMVLIYAYNLITNTRAEIR